MYRTYPTPAEDRFATRSRSGVCPIPLNAADGPFHRENHPGVAFPVRTQLDQLQATARQALSAEEQAAYEHIVTAVRAALADAAFEAAWLVGRNLPLDRVVGEALEAVA